MANKITEDPRIDPRIKRLFGEMQLGMADAPDVASREEYLERMNTPEAQAMQAAMKMFLSLCDSEQVAPSSGLTSRRIELESAPDGNTINIHYIRPDTDATRPGAASLRPMALPWRWWIFATQCCPPRYPRWRLSRRGSMTACPG
jgi:hypothetical protein